MIFFEDLAVGATFDLGRHRLEPDEIAAFARVYDRAALAGAADRSAAPGWLLTCLWMRGWVAFVERADAAAAAAGWPVADLGPSPGIERLEWPAPAHAGDTLAFRAEVRALRPSQSRPRWGLMTLANSARLAADDGRGACVMSFTSSAFVERRNARGEG